MHFFYCACVDPPRLTQLLATIARLLTLPCCCQSVAELYRGACGLGSYCKHRQNRIYLPHLGQCTRVNIMRFRGGSPLQIAAEAGQLQVVQQLLDEGANVNDTYVPGKAPLYLAAKAGHTDIVQLLLEAGTDVQRATRKNWNPLQAAASEGHRDVVQLLLAAGADIEQADSYGRTPLRAAVEGGNLEVVQLLLAAGADVHAAHGHGLNLLYVAAVYSHRDMVQLLLRKGADPQLRIDGRTALCVPAEYGYTDIVQLLLEAWGQPQVPAADLISAARTAEQRGHVATVARLAKDLQRLYPAELHRLFELYNSRAAAALVAAVLNAWASDVSSLDEQQAAVCMREEKVASEKQAVQQLIVGVAGIAKHAQQHHA